MTLFFKHWLQCKIFKIGNLRFIEGKLDEQYILEKVENKTNIYSEISILRDALKHYKQHISNHNPDEHGDTNMPVFLSNGNPIHTFSSTKSKIFYSSIVSLKAETPIIERYWMTILQAESLNVRNMYKNKILYIKDKKLSEFNFKVIHRILPCKVNLVRWKKSDTNKCNICDLDETVEHLLYYCEYANTIWQDFTRLTGMSVTLTDVIVGDRLCNTFNFVITLVAYLIYKKWLLESINNIPRNQANPSLQLLLPDIKYRTRIYENLKWNNIVNVLNQLF
jgi:hypothetical protein